PLLKLLAVGVLTPIVQLLSAALTWLVDKALRPAAEWFGQLAAKLGNLDWGRIWQTIVDGARAVVDWLAALPGKIVDAVSGLASQLGAWALGLFVSFGQWIA